MARKFSDFTSESSPQGSDQIIGYRTAAAGGSRRFTLSSVLAWIQANIAPAWASIAGKPASFTPAAHGHGQSDISGLEAALGSKADASALGAHSSRTDNPHATTPAQIGAETPAGAQAKADGAASAAVSAHAAASDPHAQYLNQARGDARYLRSVSITDVPGLQAALDAGAAGELPSGWQISLNGSPTAYTIPISWPAIAGAADYEVQISLAGQGDWLTVETPTTAGVTVSDLDPQTSYDIRVRARSPFGRAPWSPTFTQSTGAPTQFSYEFWVSPSGSDSNPGTQSQPFATIAKARDALRTATGRTSPGQSQIQGSWTGARVHLMDGVHVLLATLVFDERDSGTSGYPIEYAAAPGVAPMVIGSVAAPAGLWVQVSSANDAWAWARMPAAAQGHVYRLNVSDVTANHGSIGPTLDQQRNMLRLVIGNDLALMSRFPNGDYADASSWQVITAAQDNGQGNPCTFDFGNTASPVGWDYSSQNVMVCGVMNGQSNADWSHHTWERVNAAASNGSGGTRFTISAQESNHAIAGSAQNTHSYAALRNGIEFIAQGTCVWRKDAGFLYYWSPAGAPASARVTVLEDLLAVNTRNGGNYTDYTEAKAAHHIHFRGLVLGDVRCRILHGGWNSGIKLFDCELRNAGVAAVDLIRSADFELHGGAVHHACTWGLRVHGGNPYDGTSGNTRIANAAIHEITFDPISRIVAAIETHRGQILPYQSPIPYDAQGYGLTVDRITARRWADSGGGWGLWQSSTFEDCGSLVADNGLIGGAGHFVGPCTIRGCTFRRIRNNPNASNGYATYVHYVDLLANWLIEDNVYEDCDIVAMVAGKNITFRRNKVTNCLGSGFACAVVMTYRGWNQAGNWTGWNPLTWDGNEPNWYDSIPQHELALINWSSDLWDSPPFSDLLNCHVAGGNWEAIRLYNEGITIVDNMMTDTSGIFFKWLTPYDDWRQIAVVGGSRWVGINLAQLQYPLGASGTPVQGGGTVPLSTMDGNW